MFEVTVNGVNSNCLKRLSANGDKHLAGIILKHTLAGR